MKTIKIESLKIRNFKGLKNETFEFNGKSVNVFGTNETGKTTLVDSFKWCLFEKDSLGNASFSIKPIDPITKQEIHNLETSVEVKLNVDNEVKILKRTYEEVYRKVRGSGEETFSGHTSNFYVDNVPTKKKDFQLAVAEIINEELFQMLTSGNTFPNLHWKTQREELFKGFGSDIKDDDIISETPKLKKLPDILKITNQSVDNTLTILVNNNKINNKKINEISSGIKILSAKTYDLDLEVRCPWSFIDFLNKYEKD